MGAALRRSRRRAGRPFAVARGRFIIHAEVAGRRSRIGPLFARLKEVTALVTIVHGNADHLVSRKDAETLQGYFGEDADVEYRHVPGGTHFLEMQAPALLFDAVKGVIARAEGRGKRAVGASS